LDAVIGELLSRRRLPSHCADTIEACQAELRAQPKISVGALCKRDDQAFGEAIPNLPRSVGVLADIERGIECGSGRAASQREGRE
jgi:hypothetical protein